MNPASQHQTHPSPAARGTFESASWLWNRGSTDGVFSSDLRVVPWKSAPQFKHQPLVEQTDVHRLLGGAPAITDLDPRYMFATQTYCVSSHVDHYLTDTWETTGRTSADQAKSHNRWPLVWIDEKGHQVLLGGHHRSFAALIQGRMVRCRVLRADGDHTLAVLPRLLVGVSTPLPHLALVDPTDAAAEITAGTTVLVPDLTVAEAVLTSLGLSDELVADRLAMAQRGRCQIAA